MKEQLNVKLAEEKFRVLIKKVREIEMERQRYWLIEKVMRWKERKILGL